MRHRCACLALLLPLLAGACAHPAATAAAPGGPTPSERLAAADALVLQGCLDCLVDAYDAYEALRAVPVSADSATAGVIRSAALIALRERQLGMVDEGYFDRALAAASSTPERREKYGAVLDVIDAVPGVVGVTSDEALRRARAANANRTPWLTFLRAHADEDPLLAAAWVWFSCGNNPNRDERTPEALVAPLVRFKDAPLVTYQVAVCTASDDAVLTGLLTANPRFHEVHLWLGLREMAVTYLDEAEQHFTDAYRWHDAWPTLMMYLSGLYMTAEEYQPSLDIADRALTLVPGFPEAMLNRMRALSYLERHDEAIAQATDLLDAGSFPSDAYYWRAWNQNALDHLDAAWSDVEAAERTWHNSEVLKLAGIIAYRRHELDTAGSKFDGALQINPGDCEARFDRAGVYVDLPSWSEGADAYARAVSCLESARDVLAQEIETLQQSRAPADRVARQVARREQQRAAALRSEAQCWFNGAVANLQIGRKDEARRLAEKVADDEQFGERAKEILARVR